MKILDLIVCVLTVAGAAVGTVRWLRVAQREHYLIGVGSRFAWKWWTSAPDNATLGVVGVVAAGLSALVPPVALVTGAVAAASPLRLGLRGRTSQLAWTRRLTTVAVTTWLLEALAVGAGSIGGGITGAIVAGAIVGILSPAAVDLALGLTRPLEELLAIRYVRRAADRLKRVHPLVIGVTGSYGKTTVKGYLAHLIGPYRTTLPSPKSFNNRAGLARTVNEFLGPATEVLIAEMGTYGPGEIAALCSWLQPEISVITAIGPAHLERFRSLDRTLAAKAEIAETARVVVLNVDDERLAGLAPILRSAGKKVVAASGSNDVADVAVLSAGQGLELWILGRRVGVAVVAPGDQPTALSNAACAAAVAIELGIPPEDVLARLANLPIPPNRLQRYMSDTGYVVFDDTFNSNPSGARIGLSRLRHEQDTSDPSAPGAPSTPGRRVVVTPGMVELGDSQSAENADFGEAAARVADQLVFVARTNRAALTEGARRVAGGAETITVDRLDQALDWVRANLASGDAVLYENDLPDHFP